MFRSVLPLCHAYLPSPAKPVAHSHESHNLSTSKHLQCVCPVYALPSFAKQHQSVAAYVVSGNTLHAATQAVSAHDSRPCLRCCAYSNYHDLQLFTQNTRRIVHRDYAAAG